jgi:hypothetical protein
MYLIMPGGGVLAIALTVFDTEPKAQTRLSFLTSENCVKIKKVVKILIHLYNVA